MFRLSMTEKKLEKSIRKGETRYAFVKPNKKKRFLFSQKGCFSGINEEKLLLLFIAIGVCCSIYSPYNCHYCQRVSRFISIWYYVRCSVIIKEKIPKSCSAVYLFWHENTKLIIYYSFSASFFFIRRNVWWSWWYLRW